MQDIEEKEIFKIENKQYTVITKVINNCKSSEKLYELLCLYVLNKLKGDI